MDTDVMSVVGVFRGGRIDFTPPANWPEGMNVVVTPEPVAELNGSPDGGNDRPVRMMREDEWPTTPEGIAEHLRRMQEFEPVELTPDEEASLAAWRAEMKRFNIEAVREQMGLPE